jgi:phosphatidylglycerol:prolipoprotein diacylglycerol transferase
VLFTLPGVDWEVSSYGFFLGLALVLGWLYALRLAARDRLPADRLGTSYVLTVGLALFAARLVWLLGHPGDYTGVASLVTFTQGGLSSAGAIVVAVTVAIVHTNAMKVPTWVWLDAAAPSLAIGVALERLGAWLGGVAYGRYAPDFPLAIRYPEGSPVFEAHLRAFGPLMPPGAAESLPVLPSQLVAASLASLVVLWAVRRRRARRFAGEIAIGVAVALVASRAFVEGPMRADRADASFGPLATGQLVAIAVVVVLAGIWRARKAAADAAKPGTPKPWEGGPWSPT